MAFYMIHFWKNHISSVMPKQQTERKFTVKLTPTVLTSNTRKHKTYNFKWKISQCIDLQFITRTTEKENIHKK